MKTPILDVIRAIRNGAEANGTLQSYVSLGVGIHDEALRELNSLPTNHPPERINGGCKLHTVHGLLVFKDVRAPSWSISVTRDPPKR